MLLFFIMHRSTLFFSIHYGITNTYTDSDNNNVVTNKYRGVAIDGR